MTENHFPAQGNTPVMNAWYCLSFFVMGMLICAFLPACVCADEEALPSPFIDPDDSPEPFPTLYPPPDSEPLPGPVGGDAGWFLICSTPSGASVNFDGSDVGYTPVSVKVYSTGSPYHTIRVEKPGYLVWTRELNENPAPGETREIHATLKPDPCCRSLRITSAPSGAQIILNGVYQGKTPKTIDNLITGTYQVTLTRSGYETWSGSVDVRPDSDNVIYVVLEPMFAPITSSTLMIESYPEGAEIVLDRTSRGTTPRTLTLPEGSHTLVLRMAGYQDYSTSVFTRDKENARITAYLVPLGTVPANTPAPIIVASPVSPSSPYERLYHMGEEAAAFRDRYGTSALLDAVQKPGNEFNQDTEFMSIMDRNGTLLADLVLESWIGEDITTYTDQNTVPFGLVRRILADHGGGLLYENCIANNSSSGELCISAVIPESDGIIITASRHTNEEIPSFSDLILASLLSSSSSIALAESAPGKTACQEVVIPARTGDTSGDMDEKSRLFDADKNGISLLPVIYALAFEGGGMCYGFEPEGTDITLFSVSPVSDGQIPVRWISGTSIEPREEAVIHS
ncbi:MAG TPA: PEGA domain-containing protein [Methanospirillum sp.]|nr:PEGA domain-containing protein [Methanospirillum sp.]HOJ95337.1 PEGA domain-containing protein [Methanospirillum sp.]